MSGKCDDWCPTNNCPSMMPLRYQAHYIMMIWLSYLLLTLSTCYVSSLSSSRRFIFRSWVRWRGAFFIAFRWSRCTSGPRPTVAFAMSCRRRRFICSFAVAGRTWSTPCSAAIGGRWRTLRLFESFLIRTLASFYRSRRLRWILLQFTQRFLHQLSAIMLRLLLHRPSRFQTALTRLQFVLVLNRFQFNLSQPNALLFVQITVGVVVFVAVKAVVGPVASWPRFFHRVQCFPLAGGDGLRFDLLGINGFPFGGNKAGRDCGRFLFAIDRYAVDIFVNWKWFEEHQNSRNKPINMVKLKNNYTYEERHRCHRHNRSRYDLPASVQTFRLMVTPMDLMLLQVCHACTHSSAKLHRPMEHHQGLRRLFHRPNQAMAQVQQWAFRSSTNRTYKELIYFKVIKWRSEQASTDD